MKEELNKGSKYELYIFNKKHQRRNNENDKNKRQNYRIKQEIGFVNLGEKQTNKSHLPSDKESGFNEKIDKTKIKDLNLRRAYINQRGE